MINTGANLYHQFVLLVLNKTIYLLNRTNYIMVDVLSDILSKVKLSSTIYFNSDFSEPWGMEVSKGPFAQFHIVTRGQCLLKTNNVSIQLFAGDIVVFPHGASHWLADNEKSNRRNGLEVVESIIAGKSFFNGDKLSTSLVCGHFDFDNEFDHPFIKELPSIIHIKDNDLKQFSWLKNIAELVIQESSKNQSGSSLIVNKLGEVLFIHALRAYINRYNLKSGFVAAMQDERISRVLKEIHTSAQKDWTIDQLAQIAAMSRTSFANRFKALTGETPFNYLTQWRMLNAEELLKESRISVGEIAERIGYQSEAAFNRVFKKRTNKTPLKFRQHANAS